MELSEAPVMEPVKRGFKKTEVGVIPEDWNVRTVGELAEFANGKPHEDHVDSRGRYSLITLDSIDIRGKLKSEHRRIDFLDNSLHQNDLVIILSDIAHARLLGLCDVIPENGRYVLNQRVGRLRPTLEADPQFLRLQINLRQEHFRSRGQGTSQRHIYRRDIDVLKIPFPRLEEQRAIATALSDVDGLLGSLDALIAKKKAIKQGAMQQLLTGKQRLPGFKGEWVEKPLSAVGTISGAGVDKLTRTNELHVRLLNYMDVFRKDFIRSADIAQWVTAPAHKATRCAIQKGDVFFTPSSEMRKDIAISAVAMEDLPDAVYSYHLVRLRLNEPWDLTFRTYAFKTNHFIQQAETTCEGSGTRYVITLKKFRELVVRYPADVKEQTAIATVLSDMDAEIGALQARRAKTGLLKQGMMQELLTGRTRLI